MTYIALALLSAVPASAAAQTGTIEVIARAERGTLLEAVVIRVESQDGRVLATALTQQAGRARVGDLLEGTYTVVFEQPGWETARQEGVVVDSGQTTRVEVTLSPAPFSLNPITVSAARQEEKLLDAPASVTVLDREVIMRQPAVTITDHLEGMVGVDVARTGLENANIVARGFNSLLSGSMLTLIDNRPASVPSLRINATRVYPITNFDLERIEVVRGPGSAIYGLNASQGVMHMVTKSPIDDPGAAISISGGVREQAAVSGFDASTGGVTQIEGRVARRFSERFGAKLSGRYFQGTDWRYRDPTEIDNAALAQSCLDSFSLLNPDCQFFGADEGLMPDSTQLGRVGRRDFAVGHWTLDARADWRPRDGVTAIFSTGLEYTENSFDVGPAGTVQVGSHLTHFGQARVTWENLFGQLFFSRNEDPGGSDPTYFIWNGRPIPEESWNLGAQLQHSRSLGDRQSFVYGTDFQRVTPVGEGSIHGVHESDDEHYEAGAYLQSETSLGERWDLTLALRTDWHSVLDRALVSPRAAIVFSPSEGHRLRATYNKAFQTPTSTQFYVDLSAQRVPLGGPFSYDVRAQGTLDRGFSYRRIGGRPAMRSPFAPLVGGVSRDFLPTTTAELYALARELLRALGSPAAALMDAVGVPTESEVGVVLLNFDAIAGEFVPVQGGFASLTDIPPVREQMSTSYEIGYKGLFGGRVLVTADAYYVRQDNFFGPFLSESPNAFLNGAELVDFFVNAGVDRATAEALAIGTPEAPGISMIPLGVVAPVETVGAGAGLLFTTRNLGSVDLFGTDLEVDYRLDDRWSLGLGTSLVSRNAFETGGVSVALNAPKVKTRAFLGYADEESGFNARLTHRYVGTFPVNDGILQGEVEAYHLLDFQLGFDLPGFSQTSVQLDVNNLTDAGYRPYIFVPQMGRLTMVRLVHHF